MQVGDEITVVMWALGHDLSPGALTAVIKTVTAVSDLGIVADETAPTLYWFDTEGTRWIRGVHKPSSLAAQALLAACALTL